MQRVSSEAKAADLHSSDLQAELRHQQEGSEERDAEIRRLQKVYTVQLQMLKGPVTDCIVPTGQAELQELWLKQDLLMSSHTAQYVVHPRVPDWTCLSVMFQTVEAIDSERDMLQADLDSKAEMVANLTEELELGHQQADDANRYTCHEKKRKEQFTLFSVHDGSLLRRQPGALVMISFQQHDKCKVQETLLLCVLSLDLEPCTRVMQGAPACFWHQFVRIEPSSNQAAAST